METIRVKTQTRSYDVNIGGGNLISAPSREMFCTKAEKIAVITDDNVDAHYGDILQTTLEKFGFLPVRFVIPHGEASKTLKTFGSVCEFLAESDLTRSDAILALGGGVVGDIAGFCAASYMRGIDFIQCPTSLLAMVDSSVGGKTAVDLPQGKNLVGAFYQPKAVICDTHTLKTLPNEYFLDGLGEVIKYGFIKNTEIIDILEKLTTDELKQDPEKIIALCVKIKRDIVEADEFDNGERALLNFGHTIGHALEKLSSFSGLSHGIAVANGMVIITKLSEKMGLTKPGTANRIENLNKKFGIDRDITFSKEEIANAAGSDKKRGGGDISLVFCKEPGVSFTYKMPYEKFCKELLMLL
jgi:3-dehydroquinate synthase